ncbi:hypothetical protein WJX72_008529 [[Myrmecia] bisecta]|uniref:Uncharacterized protein n=2 Tax=[Myrmecia] bisecta TaxID=41462 RepID=A0AAW1Q0E1_9CHLO
MGSGELPEDRALVQILADAKEQRARAEAALLYGGYARTVRLADQSLVLFQDPADHDDASASSSNPPAARTLTLAVVTPDDSLDAMALELASYNLQSDLCPPLPQAPAGSAMLVADGLVSLTAAPGVVDQSPAEGVVPAMVGHEPGMHAAIGALQRQPAREGKTELEMAVADPDRRLMQAQQAAEGYREQLHGTQHQLADMQRHHQAALQQLRGRQMDLTRSEVDLVEAKQKLRQLEAQVPAPSGALRISGFEDLIEEASSELERVEGQLREASQQLLDLRSHNATLADEVDQAAHAKQKAEEEADQASQALQDILVEVTAAKHEQQRLQAAAAKLREGISSEEQAAERLSRSVAEQEAALRQVEAGIQKAKHRQVEQEQQNIRLEQERSVAVDAAKRAAHELEVVRVDLNTSQSQLAEQRAQQAEVAAQLAHLRQQAEQAQEKLADLQYAAQETATVKTAAKREAVAASEQLQQIKQQVEAVSRQLADIEKELHASRAEVADAAAQRDEHEKAAKRLHAEHVNAVSMLEQAKQALQEAIQQREHQDQATAAAKQEAVATSHAHEEAVQALEQLKAEHSQLSDVAAKLRQELAASGNESWHPRQPLMPMQPGSVQGSLRASDLPSTRWPSPQHANAGVKVAGQQALVQQLQQEVDGLQAALLAEQSKRRQTERMVLHIDQQSVSDADPEAMTMQCGKLRAQLAASEAEQAHLQEMLRELRDRNMRQGAEIGRLKQRLAQANLTPDISPRALSPHSTAQHSMGLASQYRATWQEMDRRQEDLQSCRQQVQEQRLLLDSLQSESRALQQHNEQRQMQLEVLHQEYLSLQARIATEAQLLTPLPTQPRQHQTIRSPRRSHPRDENPAAQEAAHLAAALRKAEQRAAERERDMAVLQARLDALHKDKLMLQQQRDELNSQVNVLARESHQASLDCKQLQQQLGRQASELAGLEARLGQAQYANSELKQQNQRLQSATAEESDNIQRLRCELAEQVNECQRLRERCKAAEAAAAQAQQELSAQQATANTLFQRLQHAEALASDRQDHTSSLGGRLEALESAKAAADILAEESRQQLQLLRSQLERAEAGQRQAAEAASLLREQLQAAEADATRADEPHHRAAAAVRALEEEVALLSRRLQSAEQRERQRGQHTQIATRDEAHELAGQLEQLEDAEINLTCVQLEAEEYKLLASRYQESYRVSEQRVKGLQAELEHVTAKLKSASRRISDSAVAAHAEDVKARPRASRDAAPAAHAEDAKAAEFERLRVEAEKKLAQAELATLRRQVAEHRDELRLAQKQLKQVKAELQHAEAAALQLQHVQQELAALEQDLQTKAAQRAAAVVTSRPDHAAHAMRHERTQTAELTDAKAVQLEAANKSLHDALGRLAAALQDAVRLGCGVNGKRRRRAPVASAPTAASGQPAMFVDDGRQPVARGEPRTRG